VLGVVIMGGALVAPAQQPKLVSPEAHNSGSNVEQVQRAAATETTTPPPTKEPPATGPPAWRKPTPGSSAFLGDDGGDTSTKTVCDTADHYRRWINSENTRGCRAVARGTRATILAVEYDQPRDLGLPIAKIKILEKGWVGYSALLGLYPAIPRGAPIHLRHEGGGTLRLAETADAELEAGLDLGDNVNLAATVLKYVPSSRFDRDLFVTITEGEYSGRRGWVFSDFDTLTEDGSPTSDFAGSIINNASAWRR
jgi:hypothetical protein